MTKLNVVTAFNENSLKDHAHQMFNRVDKFWHPNIKLSAYHFECALDAYSLPETIAYKKDEQGNVIIDPETGEPIPATPEITEAQKKTHLEKINRFKSELYWGEITFVYKNGDDTISKNNNFNRA